MQDHHVPLKAAGSIWFNFEYVEMLPCSCWPSLQYSICQGVPDLSTTIRYFLLFYSEHLKHPIDNQKDDWRAYVFVEWLDN